MLTETAKVCKSVKGVIGVFNPKLPVFAAKILDFAVCSRQPPAERFSHMVAPVLAELADWEIC
ncbi:MAG: hypothetical protein LBU34_12490 [Planctomycetaceae bacterium]|jgi:hypothetical protein|nr:hypothetical protein [Planctomycetaceae bacterium]